MDFMFRSANKAAWDDFALQFHGAELRIDEIGPIGSNQSHHVNVRLIRPSSLCTTLALGGPGVEWIAPATVASPERVWAGGSMRYWKGTS